MPVKANDKVMSYIGGGKYRVGTLSIIGTSHYITDEQGITYGPYFDIEIEPYNEDEVNGNNL